MLSILQRLQYRRKMRSISNFHNFLEEEFKKKISLGALRHFANQENLKLYLTKPDYDEPPRDLYYVAEGIEHFSSHKSTKVKISRVNDKLLIFENQPDGVFLGEAVPQKKYDHSAIPEKSAVKKNEAEQIADFIEQKGFFVDQAFLSKARSKGLTLDKTRAVYQQHPRDPDLCPEKT